MHRKLIIEAFKKAKKEQGFNVKTHVTEFLSDYITEQTKKPYGERILRNHYNNAILNKNEDVELKSFAAECLSKYLGSNHFGDYLKKHKDGKTEIKTTSFLKRHKVFVIINTLVVLVGFTIISSLNFNSQRWMIWQEDHYEEVAFDTEKYNINDLKIYKEERIEKFKKIDPDCKTAFFKDDGTENIWYGKNNKKELCFFKALGLHPKTKKTLKPITNYMIKKYICKKYEAIQ